MISDGLLSWLFIVINFGMPITFAILFKISTVEKNEFLSGIGAFIPALIFHMAIIVDYHLNNLTGPDSFAYHAQWVMAGWVGPSVGMLFLLVRRFLLKRLNKLMSFLLGFVPCSALYLAISL
jgi:hypothetical protein